MQNGFLNAFGIGKDFIVPKANDAPAALLEPRRTSQVGIVVSMLTAIRLDNETMRDADEVDDERTDRTLPAKLVTRKTTAAQRGPQTSLGIGHIDT